MIVKNWHALFLALAILGSGCSRKNVRSEAPPGSGMAASGDVMGPPLPPRAPEEPQPPQAPQDTGEPSGPMGPLPPPDFVPPKEGYVLVLGPGLARALSYMGVIRELESRDIRINAVVAVEMGAVIGGIWASSNSNNVEWEMHKFKRETLLDYPLLGLRGKVAEGKKLYKFLEDGLKANQLQKTKIPFYVASIVRGSDALLLEANGSSKDIIRGAMAIPGVMKPFSFEGKDRETAALEKPFPVSEAKGLGLGKTLCVDAIGKGNDFSPKDAAEEQLSTLMRSVAALARGEIKDCDVVIPIPVQGVGYLDFEARADLIYRGKQAVRKWLEQAK